MTLHGPPEEKMFAKVLNAAEYQGRDPCKEILGHRDAAGLHCKVPHTLHVWS